MKQQLSQTNEQALKCLSRTIALSQGQFTLILASCESRYLQRQIIQQLHEISPVLLQSVTVHPSITTIFTTLKTSLANQNPNAVMVMGLDSVIELEEVLRATNLVREELRNHFPLPIILWVNEEILYHLRRLAPDLRNWSTNPICFEVSNNSPRLLEISNHPNLLVEVLSSHSNTDFDSSDLEVVVMEPHTSDELPDIANILKQRKSIILNLTKMGSNEITRAIDFLSGCVCALQGSRQKISDGIFLFTPSCVKVSLKVSQQYQVSA